MSIKAAGHSGGVKKEIAAPESAINGLRERLLRKAPKEGPYLRINIPGADDRLPIDLRAASFVNFQFAIPRVGPRQVATPFNYSRARSLAPGQ